MACRMCSAADCAGRAAGGRCRGRPGRGPARRVAGVAGRRARAWPWTARASAWCPPSRYRNRVVDSRVVWAGQPWVAVCAATATRVGRSVSSQARAVSGSVRVRHGCARPGHRGPAVRLGRVQGVHGGGGGGQVVVEQAGQGGAAFGWRVLVAGPVGGVGADQVVEGVPAGSGPLQQMIAAQVIAAGLAAVGRSVSASAAAAYASRSCPGCSATSRSSRLLVGGQVLVGQVEGEFDAGVQAPVAVAFVEPVGVVGQGPAGCAADVRRRPARARAAGGRSGGRSGPRRAGPRRRERRARPGSGTPRPRRG